MLERLVHGLFDYAGMFPPAKLSFGDALATSGAFHHALRRPGLVGADLVLAPPALPSLTTAAVKDAGFAAPIRVCIVGLDSDAAKWQPIIRAAAKQGHIITALEAASEDPVHDDWSDMRTLADEVGARLYVEAQWGDDVWAEGGHGIWDMLSGYAESGSAIGLKIRCAGPYAIREALPEIIVDVVEAELPFKATQGLHHALPTDDQHGFLSLVTALRLQGALGIGPEPVRAILEGREPESYSFDGLGWGEYRARGQRVVEAMERVPFSIGSCSLDEPDEELRQLFG